MNQTLSPEVLNAMKLEGYLDKTKPGTFSISSKRYLKFIENGCVLAYANKKEDFDKGQIKGQLSLNDIKSIETHTPTKFEVKLSNTSYQFTDKDPSVIEAWITSLKLLNQHAIDHENNWEKRLQSIHPDFIIQEETKGQEAPTESRLSKLSKSVGRLTKSFSGFVDVKEKTNQDYLQAKKFNEVLDLIDPMILKSRIKMGILIKETKDDNMMNENLERRWCLLLSSKPILQNEVDLEDEATLERGSIPLDLDYDTLYLFDESCDATPALDVIPMKDVAFVLMKKKTKFSDQFQFVLDLGHRKITLHCPSFNDMDLWLHAIQTSRVIAGEYERSKLPVLKNMNVIFRIEKQEGEQMLDQKIKNDFEKILSSEKAVGIQDVRPLILTQDKVARELINVVNACLACDPERRDLIEKYLKVYHEGILIALRAYFNKNTGELVNGEVFEMVKFLMEYSRSLEVFGNEFVDRRIMEGVTVLCRISGRKILKSNMRVVDKILRQQIEDDPILDARGRLVTNGPQNLMERLNDSLQTLQFCKVEDYTTQLLKTCHNTFVYFQSGLEVLIEEADISNLQLVGICNDIMTFVAEIKEFCGTVTGITGLNQEELLAKFNHKTHNKKFVKIGKKSMEKIAENIFAPILEDPNLKWFFQTDLDQILEKVLSIVDDLIDKIHLTYSAKLRSYLLKQTVSFYLQTFINSAEQKMLKKKDRKEIISCLQSASQAIIEAKTLFKDIKPSEFEKVLKPIKEIEEFLSSETDPDFLPEKVQMMKKSHGESIKWSTIEHLLQLREDNIDKESQKELISACKEIFKITQEITNHNKSIFKSIKQSNQSAENNSTAMSDESTRSSILRNDSLSNDGSRNRLNTTAGKAIPSQVTQGYLTVDCDTQKNALGARTGGKSDLRYFTLRKERIYCYKEINSENALGSIDMKNIEECVADINKVLSLLVVEDNELKRYCFVADSEEKRNMWVKNINNGMNVILLNNLVSFQKASEELWRENIFEEGTPLFIDIEPMPLLQYEFKKPSQADAGKSKSLVKSLTTLSSFCDSPSPVRRKRSLTLLPEGDLIEEEEPEPQIGFCAKMCLKIGFIKSNKKKELQVPSQSFVKSTIKESKEIKNCIENREDL